jgi:hypothetical protein
MEVGQAKVSPIGAESTAQQYEARERRRRHFAGMAEVDHDRCVIRIFLERVAGNATRVIVREAFGARNDREEVMLGMRGHRYAPRTKAPGPIPRPSMGRGRWNVLHRPPERGPVRSASIIPMHLV